MPCAPDWVVHLGRDERLLWHGAPHPPHPFSHIDPAAFGDVILSDSFAKAGLFMVFAAFCIVLFKDSGPGFVVFGVALFFAPLAIAFLRPLVRAWVLRRSFYALTDQRVLFFRCLVGRWGRLGVLPLGSDIPLRFDGADPGTIRFSADGAKGAWTWKPTAAFEYLPDAIEVVRLIEAARRARLAAAAAP